MASQLEGMLRRLGTRLDQPRALSLFLLGSAAETLSTCDVPAFATFATVALAAVCR